MSKKLSEQELTDLLDDAQKKVAVGEHYQHYKGDLYEVVDVAIMTEEIGVGVIYKAQYGRNVLFVRPLEIFLEEIELKGKCVKRFAKV